MIPCPVTELYSVRLETPIGPVQMTVPKSSEVVLASCDFALRCTVLTVVLKPSSDRNSEAVLSPEGGEGTKTERLRRKRTPPPKRG